MNSHRRFLTLAILVLVVSAFAWGYSTHETGTFPDALIQSFLQRIGLRTAPPPHRLQPETSVVDSADLLSLPYLSGSPDTTGGKRGVTVHDPERAHPGLNLYSSARESQAFLLDMEGQLIHRWEIDTGEIQHVELFPDGSLLALVRDVRLLRLGRDSRVIWEFESLVHHDLWTHPETQEIWVLTRKRMTLPERHPTIPILVDFVTVLTPEGQIKEEINLLECLERSPFGFLLPSVAVLASKGTTGDEAIDILHANHVEMIGSSGSSLPAPFYPGNLLVSFRNINAVAVLDPNLAQVVWLWGPNSLVFQHHPTLLPSGNLLIFDNRLEQSRVIEIDPSRNNELTWQYGPLEGFFSQRRGSNQRLANGNTLITESDKGRVIEVTRDGEIVWEFLNHDLDDEGLRGPIWRMTRIEQE